MSGLKQIISAICTALICLGVLRIAVPDSRIKKSVEMAFGLAALLAVITPIFSVVIAKKGSEDISANANTAQFRQTIDMAEHQCESMAKTVLASIGYEGAKIFVNMDINEKESISINSVKILGISAADATKAREAVAYVLGIDSGLVEVADE